MMKRKEHDIWFAGLLKSVFDFSYWKIAIAAVFNFLLDGHLAEAMMALLVLVIFDFITAIASCRKCSVPIESRLIFRTAVKIAVYFLLVSAGRLGETSIQGVVGFIGFIDESIVAFLALTELISIIENVGQMGYAIPLKLLNRLTAYKDTIGGEEKRG